jgi:hypothetical protein
MIDALPCGFGLYLVQSETKIARLRPDCIDMHRIPSKEPRDWSRAVEQQSVA